MGPRLANEMECMMLRTNTTFDIDPTFVDDGNDVGPMQVLKVMSHGGRNFVACNVTGGSFRNVTSRNFCNATEGHIVT